MIDEDYDWIDILIDTDPIRLGSVVRQTYNAALKIVENCYPMSDGRYEVDHRYITEFGELLERLRSQAE